MDESVVNHINKEDFNVIMIYDSNSLEFDFSIINNYTEKYLVAWSMGVMCATFFDIDYISSTAINGTLKPIDNQFGIPIKIYDLTIKGLTPNGAKKFVSNMFKESIELPNINREFENIKNELINLKTYSANSNFKYDKILISTDDKIIPTKNQVAFWGIEPNINSGHCPFLLFRTWRELL